MVGRGAGFSAAERRRCERKARLRLDEEERALPAEVGGRYRFVSEDELALGLERTRADAAAAGDEWVDPRPTWFLRATRPPRAG